MIYEYFCINKSSFFIIIIDISLFIKQTSDMNFAEEIVDATLPHFAVLFSDVLAYGQWEPFTYTSKFSTLLVLSASFSAHFY